MKVDFENASFKDFENIPGLDPFAWADLWSEYLDYKRYGVQKQLTLNILFMLTNN